MKMVHQYKRVGVFSLLATLVGLLAYASVGMAALTFNSTAVTSDGALTFTGSGASTWDVGTGALSLQITNNGPITTGTGLLTVAGNFFVSGASSSVQRLTFTNATGTLIVVTTASSTNVSSTRMDVTGTFSAGSSTVLGSLGINTGNNGATILNHFSTTRTFTIGTVASSSCTTATSTTVTGAAAGDTVIASPTPAANGIEVQNNVTWLAYASTTNVVAFKACNTGFTNSGSIASQTWRFDVWQH